MDGVTCSCAELPVLWVPSLRLLTMHTDANPSRVHTSKWVKAVYPEKLSGKMNGVTKTSFTAPSARPERLPGGDRGESVDRDFDGPDLGVLIQVPDKKQLLSFYFYDPTPLADNDLDNSLKDYILEIRKLPANFDFDSFLGLGKEEEVQEEDLFREPSYDGLKDYIPLPVLARSRVKSFAGCGVYKNFIVEGSGWYYVRILKNYSVSTTLNGVFISSLDETKIAVDKLLERLNQKSFYYGLCIPSPPPLNSEQASKLSSSLLKLWAASQDMRLLNGKEIFSSRKLGIYAYRHLLATQAPDEIKKNWRWRLKIWETEDRKGACAIAPTALTYCSSFMSGAVFLNS